MRISARLSTALAVSAVLLPIAARAADPAPTEVEKKLEQQIDQMQQQLLDMKSQLQQLKKQNETLAEQQQQQQQAAQVQQVATTAKAQGGISPDLSLWGYGEIYYTHPTHDAARTTTDLARAVFGIGYRFDDQTVFNSEFEVEHAVASAGDSGEFEVEQFYVDHQLASWASVKGGLFLMPFGLLNEHHEPTQYYGVQRNFVETLIIPSTWREGGLGFHGNTALGLTWDGGITTGLNLSEWNANPEDPLYRSALELNEAGPMQQGHQELQFAKSQNLSQYLALNYNGLPGLLTGAAVFTGKAATRAGLPSERTTLWETHARWTPGAADISAVFARGTFSNTGAFNALNPGASNPMPASFLGYYLQGAYTAWERGGYRFSPFFRWEHYDTGASFAGIAPGFTPIPQGLAADGLPWPQTRDQVWSFGGNFYVTPHVVLKADYQTFRNNKDFTRFDLGLGLAY